MRKIVITYEIVTDESAAEGDVAESGWLDEDGVSIVSPAHAYRFLSKCGAFIPSSSAFHPGIWWSTEPEQSAETGAYESRSYHLKGFTERAERMVYTAITGRES